MKAMTSAAATSGLTVLALAGCTAGNGALSWSYWGCPGGTSNFQVTEYNTDGSPDLNGVTVNELGTGRGPVATYAYGDSGTHYLSVNTEGCSWSLVPVTV